MSALDVADESRAARPAAHRAEAIDDIGRLLAVGERAAFHGRPAAGIAPLEAAQAASEAAGREAESLAARWLLGVCCCAAGQFGRALRELDPLARFAGEATAEQRVFAALGAATMASIHRQLGRHLVARAYDEHGLAQSEGAAEATFDCHLGLAADAVGLGEIDVAVAGLQQAQALADHRPDWWRQRVRAGWVRAEISLLRGDTASAGRAAEAAVALAEASGAPRHVAKGLLFAGVSLVEGGHYEEAVLTMRRAAMLAESLGTFPLVWPTRAMLGALLADADPAESERSLDAARAAAILIGEELPDDLRLEWFARPDVAALLGI